MAEEYDYNPDLITVTDEEGTEHTFEILDRIENDAAKYAALIPVYEDAEDMLDDDGELIILRVEEEEDGETYLCPIEDDEEFDEIGAIFQQRLEDYMASLVRKRHKVTPAVRNDYIAIIPMRSGNLGNALDKLVNPFASMGRHEQRRRVGLS